MAKPGLPGGIRLFQLFGIEVSLHWTWAIIAFIEIQHRRGQYSSLAWNVAEYVTLFVIVLLHEFGHALACRSVGGQANHIMLWPLGGVAFVSPPQRPGAVLWSIAAGPLVNVMLIPVTVAALFLVGGVQTRVADLQRYVFIVGVINIALLVFNMLPIYPLDGGQILRALLWFFIGPARSLQTASVIGLIGAAGVVVLALALQDIWLIVLAGFGALQSWSGLRQAQALRRVVQSPRYEGLRCPACGQAPPAGRFWSCRRCGQPVDVFAAGGVCPRCGELLMQVPCVDCGRTTPIERWFAAPPPPRVIITPPPVNRSVWPPP